MLVDCGCGLTCSKEIDKPGQGAGLHGLVRDTEQPQMAWVETRWAWGRSFGKDITHFWMVNSCRVAGGGNGPEGSEGTGPCGSFDNIIRNTSLDGEASPSDVRALMAFLYRPFCTAHLALLMLQFLCDESGGGNFERERPAETAPAHRSAIHPASHLSRWDFTSSKISLSHKRWPAAGLASKHFAAMKILDQPGIFTGSEHTHRHSLKTLAQRSLVLLGIC